MSQELVQSGNTYYLTNAKAGTVLDLSGQDNRSIIGYPYHTGTNQQWKVDWAGHGWTFRAVSSGLYLAIDGSPADGTKLVAVTTPFTWHIWHDEKDPSTYRIFVPNTSFNIDLSGHGNSAPGTPITLWYQWAGVHQTWKFTKV